jgi:SIR2-like domain
MPHILLTGAGFSRNWGGWLADEAFEYLLGHPRIDGGIRTVLWRFKNKGGFEAALEDQRAQALRFPSAATIDPMQRLEDAIRGMFDAMNKGFFEMGALSFNFELFPNLPVKVFLTRFDAIFTLNQDVLVEQRYLDSGFGEPPMYRKWAGWQIPGMQHPPNDDMRPHMSRWTPMEASEFALKENHQPYVKLHGSSNSFDTINGQPMLVIGGNKPEAIGRHPILKWNFDQFKAHLSKPDTRLMIIGYSFGDEHINQTLVEAATERGKRLRLFIIDPNGVDVLERSPLSKVLPKNYPSNPLQLQDWVVGASRRLLQQIFGGDSVEHGKVMRFFD